MAIYYNDGRKKWPGSTWSELGDQRIDAALNLVDGLKVNPQCMDAVALK